MKDKLSPFLCGFRKQHSTQHALIRIIEKWKKCMDDSGTIVAVLMDLSKAYHCIRHDLLIAKLRAYCVRIKTLKLLFSYLTNRKQRVKVNRDLKQIDAAAVRRRPTSKSPFKRAQGQVNSLGP